MNDFEIQQLKNEFKRLFNKNPDEEFSAFLSFINSAKIGSLKIILLELQKDIRNLK